MDRHVIKIANHFKEKAWYNYEKSVLGTGGDGLPSFYALHWERDAGLPCSISTGINHSFYENDKLCRWIGPADVHNFDSIDTSNLYWFIDGEEIDPEKYFAILDQNGMDINNLSDDDKMLIRMGFVYD